MSTTTQWRVPPWAWLPLGCALVAEAVSNALRAYGLGTHLEKFTVHYQGWEVSIAGAVLVLAAIAVTLSQARAAWVALTPIAPARQRIVSGLAALLLLAVSVAAMASHLLEAQRAKVGDEAKNNTGYSQAKADYDRAAGEVDRLKAVKTTTEVRAAMDRVRVPKWAYDESAQCTADMQKMTPAVQKLCRPLLDLRIEMAQAITKDRAIEQMNTAKAILDTTPVVAVADEAETMVTGFWPWAMGLAVVFLATFGSVIFAKVDSPTPVPAMADTPEKVADTPGQTDFDAVKEPVLGPQPTPTGPGKKRRKRKDKNERATEAIRAYTLKHGHPPAFSVVMGKYRLPRATASRLRKEVMTELGVAA